MGKLALPEICYQRSGRWFAKITLWNSLSPEVRFVTSLGGFREFQRDLKSIQRLVPELRLVEVRDTTNGATP